MADPTSLSFSIPETSTADATSTTPTSTSTSTTPTSTTPTSTTPTETSTTPTSTTETSTTPSSTSTTSTSTTDSSTTGSSTTPGTTAAPSSTTAAPSSTSTLFVTQSNGQAVTSVVFVPGGTQTATTSATAAAANRNSTSFFDNKGAVAGTFTAVGVVVLILLIFIATRIVRRRREKKFDDEVDQAAAEAAAAGANPNFMADDDEYDYRSNATSNGIGGGGFGAYSETSHGTLAQPPIGHADSQGYNTFAAIGAGAGAAGVGAGAMSRAKSQRSVGPGETYPAAAAAQPMPNDAYEMSSDANNNLRYRRSTGPYQYDPILGGYGSGDDPYAIARGPSMRYPSNPNLQRSGSRGQVLAGAGAEGYVNQPGQPFVPPGYPQPQTQAPLPPLPGNLHPAQGPYTGGPEYGEPYGGGAPDSALPNPHSASASAAPPAASSQAALVGRHSTDDEGDERAYDGAYAVGGEEESEDEEGEERNPRVLRVANE